MASPEPAYFADLNLDQVVSALVARRDEYDLEPFFFTPLATVDEVAARHEVFRDLEREELAACVRAFAGGMREMRSRLALAENLRYAYEKQRWFLDAAGAYCEAVTGLAAGLERLDPQSRRLRALRDELALYVRSEAFRALAAETAELGERLAAVRYRVQIRGTKVTVRRHEGEADYSRDVEETFERFRQGSVRDYHVKLPSSLGLNHVEAWVLDGVAALHPGLFAELGRFCERHPGFTEASVRAFDREAQFHLAYIEHMARFQAAGLRFCYPEVSTDPSEISARETFDLALAGSFLDDGTRVVCNDFVLVDPERILVVSGPNQGGKTTFARMFGQLHHLASLGCPVPGTEARLLLFDRLFTHFEKEEEIGDLSGKLGTDLERVHEILRRAGPRSVVVMNESFSSTTLDDARFLGTRVLERLLALGARCVYVTFVDELASLNECVVSMVAEVGPDDPARRTYRIERRPADGLAYAAVIAEKYGLGYESLLERIAS